MNMAAGLRTLDDADIARIHQAALHIISRVGLRVEHAGILARLADFGGQAEGQTVRFTPEFVEEFIAGSEPVQWPPAEARVNAPVGIFVGRYLDPRTGRHVPWTEPALTDYIKLAHNLPNVDGAGMLGCPLDLPHRLHPLYQRLLCYQYGANSGGSLWDLRLLPFIEEMTQVIAGARGTSLQQEWRASVYLLSPLKLGRVEAEHFAWCAERGYRCGVDHMISAGATGPVTIAGCVALYLAETLFSHIIRRAYYGDLRLHLHCSISVADMRTGVHPYGAPERVLANLMMADMARHYRASFSGHGGHTDAKVPSYEAAAQKVLTGLPILLAGGTMSVACGLLSTDEVYSPIQMVLDNELVGALRRLARGVEITDETLALEVIEQVGPGGQFLDQEHTARHFRAEHWLPGLFSRELLEGWLAGDRKPDVERARDIYEAAMAGPDQPMGDPAVVEQLREIIMRAGEAIR